MMGRVGWLTVCHERPGLVVVLAEHCGRGRTTWRHHVAGKVLFRFGFFHFSLGQYVVRVGSDPSVLPLDYVVLEQVGLATDSTVFFDLV